MAAAYSDSEIAAFIREPKSLPDDWSTRTTLRPKRGHNERHLDVVGESGTEFRLILRQNTINRLDFSIILAVLVPQSSQVFRLCRYNGRSHEHTNHIEGDTFYDFTFTVRRSAIRCLERAKTHTPSRRIDTDRTTMLFAVCSKTRASVFLRNSRATCSKGR